LDSIRADFVAACLPIAPWIRSAVKPESAGQYMTIRRDRPTPFPPDWQIQQYAYQSPLWTVTCIVIAQLVAADVWGPWPTYGLLVGQDSEQISWLLDSSATVQRSLVLQQVGCRGGVHIPALVRQPVSDRQGRPGRKRRGSDCHDHHQMRALDGDADLAWCRPCSWYYVTSAISPRKRPRNPAQATGRVFSCEPTSRKTEQTCYDGCRYQQPRCGGHGVFARTLPLVPTKFLRCWQPV